MATYETIDTKPVACVFEWQHHSMLTGSHHLTAYANGNVRYNDHRITSITQFKLASVNERAHNNFTHFSTAVAGMLGSGVMGLIFLILGKWMMCAGAFTVGILCFMAIIKIMTNVAAGQRAWCKMTSIVGEECDSAIVHMAKHFTAGAFMEEATNWAKYRMASGTGSNEYKIHLANAINHASMQGIKQRVTTLKSIVLQSQDEIEQDRITYREECLAALKKKYY